jgi:hypothetical protein
MADDVKVKFGGDFTGIGEGAAAAGKIAGTALSASFKSYAEDIKKSIANMFSVSNIMGKVFDGIKDSLKYFREIDELSRQLGVSREDLQKLGKIGAEVGISMDTMGRSIQFANKTIGAATISAGAQRETLKSLGFTEEEITAGRVKATDVMLKLAGEYDKHIDRNIIAKHTVDMFGRSGGELTKVLSEGTAALKERIETMKVYTDEEVRAAAAADRAVDASERAAKAGLKAITIGAGKVFSDLIFGRAFNKQVEKEFAGKVGFWGEVDNPSPEDVAKNQGSVERIAKAVAQSGKRLGLTSEDAARELYRRVENGVGLSEDQLDLMSKVAATLQNMGAKEEKKGPQVPIGVDEREALALSTSSLQAIGGGDIGSIMSGFHVDIQQEQLDVQKEIAANTAPAPAGTDKTIVNVAK